MFAPGEAEIASVSGCGSRAARDGRHDVQSLTLCQVAAGNPCVMRGALMGRLQPRNLSASAGFD